MYVCTYRSRGSSAHPCSNLKWGELLNKSCGTSKKSRKLWPCWSSASGLLTAGPCGHVFCVCHGFAVKVCSSSHSHISNKCVHMKLQIQIECTLKIYFNRVGVHTLMLINKVTSMFSAQSILADELNLDLIITSWSVVWQLTSRAISLLYNCCVVLTVL